jgi:hypothetical protein
MHQRRDCERNRRIACVFETLGPVFSGSVDFREQAQGLLSVVARIGVPGRLESLYMPFAGIPDTD